MIEKTQSWRPRPDAAISSEDDDRLARAPFALQLGTELARASGQHGFVMALCGPWGSGKSSIVNVAVKSLPAGTVVLEFNPWLFSGANDLVDRFFLELVGAIKPDRKGRKYRRLVKDRKELALSIGRYAGAVSTVAAAIPGGSPVEKIANATSTVLNAELKPIATRREELKANLRKLDRDIVVVVDDIDRVTDDEIHSIVRLAKLVGDLPRVSYVLAFDRVRVEEVLGGGDDSTARARGRAYLEKIVQTRFDVPTPRPDELLSFFLADLHEAAPELAKSITTHQDWPLAARGLSPLFRTPRDSLRVVNSIPAAFELNTDEIDALDLVILESLRVLEPDVHERISASSASLLGGTRTYLTLDTGADTEVPAQITDLIAKASQTQPAADLLSVLFPRASPALGGAARTIESRPVERRNRRAAVASVLRRYTHTTLDPKTISGRQVNELSRAVTVAGRLAEVLARMPPANWPDAIDSLLGSADSFSAELAYENAKTLIALAHDLPEHMTRVAGGYWPDGSGLKEVVTVALDAELDPDRRANAVFRLFDEARTLSDRVRVVNWFGTADDDDAVPGPLDRARTRVLASGLRERVGKASVGDLVLEPERTLLLNSLRDDPTYGQAAIRLKLGDDALFLSVLGDYCARVDWNDGKSGNGETGVRWDLDWRGFTELVGVEYATKRVLGLEISPAELADREASAVRRAQVLARGFVPPVVSELPAPDTTPT